ncbi:MAG: MBL fold metallo-hydrolase [Candidatus Thorarchaeota archaeon]
MTSIKFLGGIGEIGGNKILVEADNCRLFLDFGLSFGMQGKFYDEFLQARRFAKIDEYVDFGMLPNVPGIYREDYLKHTNPKHPLLSNNGEKYVDAVVISHAHMDHVGMIPYLRSDIDLLGSEETKRIMNFIQDTSSGLSEEIFTSYPYFRWVTKKNSTELKKASKKDLADEKMTRAYNALSTSSDYQIEDVSIEYFEVDHSLPGAAAYIIKTPTGNIAYTGDIRFHGYHGQKSKKYVKALEKSEIKVLLCEGTRAPDKQGVTEESLKSEMVSTFGDANGLVIINYPQKDTARMKTIADAAESTGRKFVISPKQAYYLNVLNDKKNMDPMHSSFEILVPRKGWGIWGNSDYDVTQQMKDYSHSFTRSIKDFLFEQSNLVTPQEIKEHGNQYVVTCTFWDLGLLHDLKPDSRCVYIWSQADPFNAEGEINYDRVKVWLNHFGLGEPKAMHCSGHMSGPEIKELIDAAKPEIVVPIHTAKPELFKDWHDDVRVVQLGDVLNL